MGIQVTSQNVDQVLGKFESFVSDANATAGKGAIAYLFPGLRNSHLAAINKPIFASRSFWRNSSVFRSDDDRRVNNYVRHLFLNAIATRLNCAVADLPRVFEWAGKLKDLKLNDFNADGRPLTARRIGTLLADLKSIEMKRLVAIDAYRAENGDEAKLPKRFANVGALSAHQLGRGRAAALPQLAARYSEQHVPKVQILKDKLSDNYMLGTEILTEAHALDNCGGTTEKVKKNNKSLRQAVANAERAYKHGKKSRFGTPTTKDGVEIDIRRLRRLLERDTDYVWKFTQTADNEKLNANLKEELKDVEEEGDSDAEEIY